MTQTLGSSIMKKTMKFIGLIAMAALLFSCEKKNIDTPVENPQETETPADLSQLDPSKYLVSFGATIESVDTKANVDLTTGDVSFVDGDEVLVVSGSASGKYKYSGDEFAPLDESDAVEMSADMKAYYPADNYSVSSNVVTFTMPEATEENPGSLAPMCAIINGSTAEFKNLGAILKLNLTAGEAITAVELVASKPIAGSSELSWNAGGIPELSAELNGASNVKHYFTTAITAGTATTLYFFLPAGIETGLEIHAIYGKTVGEVTYEPYKTIKRKTALTTVRNDVISIAKSLPSFFSSGDGSEDHPYIISTADQFKAISTLANATAEENGNGYNSTAERTFFGSAGVHYKQIENIDFDNDQMSPIGNSEIRFYGEYDGNNKELQNININETGDFVGVFAYADGDALIKSVTISGNVTQNDATSTTSVTGGIAGILNGNAKVEGCKNKATIISHATYTGGIVGRVYGSGSRVYNCINDGNVTSYTSHSGGITGQKANGTIEECINNGSVEGATYVGGIAGLHSGGQSSMCVNTGTITGSGNFVGGIAGSLDGGSEIIACRSNATIEGALKTGGIVGYLNDYGVILRCYAKGSVSGTGYVGGIVGHAHASNGSTARGVLVMECLACADVISSNGDNSNTGGVVGCLYANRVSNGSIQWANVFQCVGWSAKIKNTNTDNCTNLGAFVGLLSTGYTKAASTQARCQVRNSYTTASTNDVIWLAGTPSRIGGFVGYLLRGRFSGCYYQLDNNTQNATANNNLVTLQNFQKVDSDFASYLSTNLTTTSDDGYVGNGKTYPASEWTMTGFNGEALQYPLPSALVALGTEYYN